MKSLLRKIPWGLLAGIFGVLVFYTIAGTVGGLIVMNSITAIVEGAAGLFGTWWQTLLFVCDIIFGILFVGALVLFILTKIGMFKEEETANA